MKKNYILIDYENVQPNDLTKLNKEHFNVFVFFGENQTKVSFEFASTLQQMGANAEYIKISGNGNNALDFHIAFYIGYIATKEPDSFFHIISKDTGFDPLIQHLKNKKISVSRSKSIEDIQLIKVLNLKTPSEKIAPVNSKLLQLGDSKPKTIKTLSSTINSLFQKSLSDAEINDVIEELKKQGKITVNKSKVLYP